MAGNSVVVVYREDPNRWGGVSGQTPFGEVAVDCKVHACILVAANHRAKCSVDRGCPKGPSMLHVVVEPTGKDVNVARLTTTIVDVVV